MTEPRVSSAQRDRRVAPSTSWVAFSARANWVSAAATSPPMTSWYSPPRSASSRRCASSSSDGPSASPSVGLHVHAEQVGLGALGHAGGPADQVLAAGRAGDGDHDPLPRLPRAVDAVGLHVVLEPVVDLVGHPQQGQLAQRRQVADPEVVAQGGVDLLGRVDVAVGHAPPQRLGRHVDQLDLVGGAHHRVGHRLALLDAGDALDHVVDATRGAGC